MAGIIHALVLLVIVVVAAPLAQFIPLAVLAAILLMVAYNIGDWGEIPKLLQITKADISVWAVTFGLTVFADLTVAMQFGMVLAALLFIREVSATTTVVEVTREYVEEGRLHILQDRQIPDYVSVVRIHGPFLFGTTSKLEMITDHLESLAPVVILRLRNMTALDSTGLQTLEELADRLQASGRRLILCGARHQPAKLLRKTRFERHIGQDNICLNIQAALERAERVVRLHPAQGA